MYGQHMVKLIIFCNEFLNSKKDTQNLILFSPKRFINAEIDKSIKPDTTNYSYDQQLHI